MNYKALEYLGLVAAMDERPMTDEEIDEIIYGGLYDIPDVDDDEVSSAEDEMVDAEDVHRAGPGERGGKYGLVHENRTPCDAEKAENCPEEKAQVEADLLGDGRKKRTEDMPSRFTMLHDEKYLNVMGRLQGERYRLRNWKKANPGVNPFLYPGNGKIRELTEKLKKAEEEERDKWTREPETRIWYDEKLRKYVSRWIDGRWQTLWDRMDPKDVASIKADNVERGKQNKLRGNKVSEFAKLNNKIRQGAKKLEVSRDVYAKYGDLYLDETGRHRIDKKPFHEWLDRNGIPHDGKQAGAKRYVEMAGKSDSAPGLRPENTMAAKLAKLGIRPIVPESSDGGDFRPQDKSLIDFAMRIAEEAKRRNSAG